MNKLKLYLLILNLICGFGMLLAQEPTIPKTIDRIDLRGNRAFSKKELNKLLQVKSQDKFDSEALTRANEQIHSFYVSKGYYLAEVSNQTSESGSKINIIFLIRENSKARVGEFRFQGNKLFSEDYLKQKIRLKANDSFTQSLLEQDIEQVLKLYDQNGYPYCQILPSELSLDEVGKVSFSLKIIEGPQVKIQKVIFEDIKESSDPILRKALGIKSGEIFSGLRVEKALKRLNKIAILNGTPSYKLESTPDVQLANLRLKVKEEKNNSLEGILGYTPAPTNRKSSGAWVGKINFIFNNFLGGLREAQIKWERKDLFSSNLGFSYQQRYILNLPLAAKISFWQKDQDTSYIQTSVRTEWGYSWNEHLNSALELGWERVIPEKESQGIFPISQKISWGANLDLDYLDFNYNPQKGIYYQVQLSYATQKNQATSSYSPAKNQNHNMTSLIKLQNFIPTFDQQSLMVAANWGKIKSDEKIVPLFNQFKLGGISNLRGFREDQFSGSEVFWSNLEYRFLLSQLSRFSIFTDYGYFSRYTQENNNIKKIGGGKIGYGLGLRVESKIGLWGIDFGWGEADKLSQGKIHIGVVNRF
ncbi:MAG: outer membrane protein [candidate division Zixibacteria bacterium RBG-1]|nr:MAG: outer membrane protein [candidate division Zixibacteria bacterium RBG-1]OGC84179.1 MAG: hypothetical protein A2V73_08905 [candidate division Zixibacteria bacterium RBG_19FT_COMBO_42_43]